MPNQKVFTKEFESELKTIGIHNAGEFIKKSKEIIVYDIASNTINSNKKNIYPEGKNTHLIFQKELLQFLILAQKNIT